jgi:hypothetical protein
MTFDKVTCDGEARIGGITGEVDQQIRLEVIDEDATYLGSKYFLVKKYGREEFWVEET